MIQPRIAALPLMVWDVASAHGQGLVNRITVAAEIILSAGADGYIRQWRIQV